MSKFDAHGHLVGRMTVARDLQFAGKARAQVRAEIHRRACGAISDPPCGRDLGFRANACPRPHVAGMLINSGFLRLLAASDKAPNLIKLNHLARQITQRLALKRGASLARVHKELEDCILVRSHDSRR